MTEDLKELKILRQRTRLQRKELKRLNRLINGPHTAYWNGYRAACALSEYNAFRKKMTCAFGEDAVTKAEYGSPSKNRPWWIRNLLRKIW